MQKLCKSTSKIKNFNIDLVLWHHSWPILTPSKTLGQQVEGTEEPWPLNITFNLRKTHLKIPIGWKTSIWGTANSHNWMLFHCTKHKTYFWDQSHENEETNTACLCYTEQAVTPSWGQSTGTLNCIAQCSTHSSCTQFINVRADQAKETTYKIHSK